MGKRIMFDLNLKTTVTFNFGKLNKALDRIIPDAINNSKHDAVKTFKSNIDRGHFVPLRPSTVELREMAMRGEGVYNDFYPLSRPRDGTKILKATGKFYDSIKANDKGVSYNHYGGWHPQAKGPRPKRNWMHGVIGAEKGGKAKILKGKNLKKFRSDIARFFKIPKKNIRGMKF